MRGRGLGAHAAEPTDRGTRARGRDRRLNLPSIAQPAGGLRSAPRFLRETFAAATVFVCLHGYDRVRDLCCRPLEIPCLAARASESDRLLQEALDEAATALGTARLRIPRCLRHGLLERVASFAELEKTALRLVALVSARNPSNAAARLRMAPVSLTRWLCRRPWLMAMLRELKAHRDRDDD